MKEVADMLGISYSYLMKRRTAMAKNNGYATPMGLIIDYAREKERKKMKEEMRKERDKSTLP